MLRRTAVLTGYGHLRAGLLISPHDAWPVLSPQLGPVPAGARVAPLELRLAPEDARAAAAEAWDLPAAAEALRAQEKRLTGALRGAPRPDGETLREYHELLRPAYRTLLWVPSLPTALLPAGWPRPDLERAIGETGRHYQPAATAYLDELLAEYGS
jgi:DNA-binding transcriptional regulator PaaX